MQLEIWVRVCKILFVMPGKKNNARVKSHMFDIITKTTYTNEQLCNFTTLKPILPEKLEVLLL